MKLLALMLSGLIVFSSPIGGLINQKAEAAIRSQFESIEALEVRVDHTPGYQLMQGKVAPVHVAGQGLFPVPDLRIAALAVETEPLDFDVKRLGQGQPVLDQPLQASVQLTLAANDINQWLRSPTTLEKLNTWGRGWLSPPQWVEVQRYDLRDPEVHCLANQRLRLQAQLNDRQEQATLNLVIETGLGIVANRQLQLVDPVVTLNDEAASALFIKFLTEGIRRKLDLRILANSGLMVNVSKLTIEPETVEVAMLLRIDPASRLLSGN
ncbi:MAG: DUF2993 domain-containing protein [Cyanothece sp. SIO1E1]|nr:DUF2993 domain-containing protein [Cyanothece sp. SIO1E1]